MEGVDRERVKELRLVNDKGKCDKIKEEENAHLHDLFIQAAGNEINHLDNSYISWLFCKWSAAFWRFSGTVKFDLAKCKTWRSLEGDLASLSQEPFAHQRASSLLLLALSEVPL